MTHTHTHTHTYTHSHTHICRQSQFTTCHASILFIYKRTMSDCVTILSTLDRHKWRIDWDACHSQVCLWCVCGLWTPRWTASHISKSDWTGCSSWWWEACSQAAILHPVARKNIYCSLTGVRTCDAQSTIVKPSLNSTSHEPDWCEDMWCTVNNGQTCTTFNKSWAWLVWGHVMHRQQWSNLH